MLISLNVSNYTVVSHLELDFKPGFSAVTGETGAGKSITMDALSLCLGERSDYSKIRKGAKEAQISAVFDIDNLPKAKKQLEDMGFTTDDGECAIRRVLKAGGRSLSYINGHSATTGQLQQLGEHLVSVCGQHAQYALKNPKTQRTILDQYGVHDALLSDMEAGYKHYSSTLKSYNKTLAEQKSRDERVELLTYQVSELDEFEPFEGEFEALEKEQKILSSGNELVLNINNALASLSENDDSNALSMLASTEKSIQNVSSIDSSLSELSKRLESSLLEIEDISNELRSYCDDIQLDPQKLIEVEERFSKYMDFSRKHGVKPENLHEHHSSLSISLTTLNEESESLESLRAELDEAEKSMLKSVKTLHESRVKTAASLSEIITKQMPNLSMEQGFCEIEVVSIAENVSNVGPSGSDQVSINVQTNSGEGLGSLGKVASGGELSRISLIIQLAIAQKQATPTLVFDEVDTGISGYTAAVIGGMLKRLGTSTQVLSITHLPQVASFGHNHFYVFKKEDGERTSTAMTSLDHEGRVMELARLLGGTEITPEAINNAEELIKNGAAYV